MCIRCCRISSESLCDGVGSSRMIMGDVTPPVEEEEEENEIEVDEEEEEKDEIEVVTAEDEESREAPEVVE